MKTYPLLSLLLVLLFSVSCATEVDLEAEKEAIIEILNLEGSAFVDRDMEQIMALHVNDSLSLRMEGTQTMIMGYDEIKAMYQRYIDSFDGDESPQNPVNIKENIIVKVFDNTAWLVCDNIWQSEYEGEKYEWGNKQIAFFEKIEGEWKFSFDAFMPHPKEEEVEVEE